MTIAIAALSALLLSGWLILALLIRPVMLRRLRIRFDELGSRAQSLADSSDEDVAEAGKLLASMARIHRERVSETSLMAVLLHPKPSQQDRWEFEKYCAIVHGGGLEGRELRGELTVAVMGALLANSPSTVVILLVLSPFLGVVALLGTWMNSVRHQIFQLLDRMVETPLFEDVRRAVH